MLKEGDKAFAFKGIDQNGKALSLASLKGIKLALYFYPKDMTETCTIQACNLRDNFSLLKKEGITVIGVSPDTTVSHKKFQSKYNLPFDMIADIDHSIINGFGVWGKKQLFGRKYMGLLRTTFLIDEKGIIRKVFSRPESRQHAKEIVDAWKTL